MQLALARGTTPSALTKQLANDLEWIVRKAVARERQERYGSVGDLAADLRAYLRSDPVAAGPPSTTYRMRRFVQRNRMIVGFSGLLLLALLGGLVARTVEAKRANREAAEARVARDDAARTVGFLVNLFMEADPGVALGEEATVSSLLELATGKLIDGEFGDQPQSRAELLGVLAQVYWQRGDPAKGLGLAETAWELALAELGGEHIRTLGAKFQVGTLASEVNQYERSERLLKEVLEETRLVEGPESDSVLKTLQNLGAIHEETGRYQEALQYYSEARAVLRKRGDDQSDRYAGLLTNIGLAQVSADQHPAGVATLNEALAVARVALPENSPLFGKILNNLGDALIEKGDFVEARIYLEEGLAVRRNTLGEVHPVTAASLSSLGRLEVHLGRWDSAAESLDASVRTMAQAVGADHPWGLVPLYHQGRLAEGRGDYDLAVDTFRRVAEHAADDDIALWRLGSLRLGQVLRLRARSGDLERGLGHLRAAESQIPDDGTYTGSLMLARAELGWLELDRPAEAERLWLTVRKQAEEAASLTVYGQEALGTALLGLASLNPENREALEEEAASALSKTLPPNHSRWRALDLSGAVVTGGG